MKHITHRIRALVFGGAVAGAMVFGVTQAVASPPRGEVPRACDPRCAPDCDGFGGELRHWGCLCCG